MRPRHVLSWVVLAVAAQAGGAPAVSAHQTPPARSKAPKDYVVKEGDTLARVATRLGVSVSTLATVNRMTDPNRVRVGQVLAVPKVGEPEPVTSQPAAPLPSPVVVVGGSTRHRVVAGENLARIAAAYRTTVAELATANGLKDPNRIREGAELAVPGPPWLCPVQGPRQYSDSWGAPEPGGRRHLGIDIFAVRGTPVVASVSGVLAHANGAAAGLAYYLRGDDGNTYYGAHLDAMDAAPGPVPQGARIGSVGSTGNARGTTPHLHFELKPGGGASVNPLPTIDHWCRS